MYALVTGGGGFVASHVVARLLASPRNERVAVLDVAPASDAMIAEFFAPFGDRIVYVEGDVRTPNAFDAIPNAESVTHVLHAAMMVAGPGGEATDPRACVDVNVGGTINALDWARRLPSLEAFLYVSSGAVYGEPTELSPAAPQPEQGPFNPPEVYAIAKFAAERLARRYGELFSLDSRAARLSGVFGPMERVTIGRRVMSLPYQVVRSVVHDRPLLLTRRTLDAGGDFISAEDVGDALVRILTAPKTLHRVYNIAFGTFTSVRDLLSIAAELTDLRFEITDDLESADVDMDPAATRARWNAYAIARVRAEFDWEPRPLAEQLSSYIAWVAEDPVARCP